jgi:hypothetical protein
MCSPMQTQIKTPLEINLIYLRNQEICLISKTCSKIFIFIFHKTPFIA